MNTTEARRSITDGDFDIISDACWEQIALFAFEKYKEKGRGAVFLDRQGLSENVLQDQVNLGYAVYKPGSPDLETARLIEEYDPVWEIVFQYMRQDGDVRTARVRTAPGNRHPWRIYLFGRLMKDEHEDAES